MASDHGQKSRQSWLRMQDWVAVLGSVTILAAGILLVLNGRCSRPAGFDAGAPMCVGSQLSVQSWLAIVGVEFSLLGSFLLPRLGSVVISKSLTTKLRTTGLPAARLLNSSPNAPLVAQMKGSKRLLVFRLLLLSLAAAVSVLYKFSFTAVDAPDRIAVDALVGHDPDNVEFDGNYTPIGDSDIPRLNSYNQFTDPALPPEIFSANLVDFLTKSNSSVAYATNATYRFRASGEQLDVIVAPKVNETSLSRVVSGTVQTCDALFYLRTSIFPVSLFENPHEGRDFPNLTQTPYNNGIRLQAFNWNQSDTLADDIGSFMDLTSLSNGSLQAWTGTDAAFHYPPDETPTYSYRVTANTKYCYGYITWDNSVSGFVNLHEPRDIQCVDQPFDLAAWNQTRYAAYAKNLLQTILAGHYGPELWIQALPVVNIIQPHWVVRDKFAPSIPRNPLCSDVPARSFAVVDGIIRQSRTGMTGAGMGLQVIVIIAGLFGMSILAFPTTIPLITDWPAQWIHLVSNFDKATIAEVSEGSSCGQKPVKSSTTLFLTAGDDGKESVLSKTRSGS